MAIRPTLEHDYHHPGFDSTRWARFTHRPGDIVVSTSYKSGTTWMQMICALLVHRSPTLPKPLTELSVWVDNRLEPIDDVVANYDAQPYRRVIKTHTPLDGLQFRDDVEYVVCGRDPRDVFMSSLNHFGNMDFTRMMQIMAASGISMDRPPELPDDVNERFRIWLTVPMIPWEHDGAPFWSTFHHTETYWNYRSLPNIHFVHYSDLKTDLDGQMRRLAKELRTEVPEATWPELIQAASFDTMKSNADSVAPASHLGVWLNNRRFFNKGTNDQWRGALSDDSLTLYQDLTRKRYDPVMLDWLERGSLLRGYPQGL